jgi:hypothetical protein
MMKKERNRLRVGPQRKAPNPKRQKLDDDAETAPEPQILRKSWTIPEPVKRMLGEQEERCTQEQKRLKKDDIRYFMKNGLERGNGYAAKRHEQSDQAEQQNHSGSESSVLEQIGDADQTGRCGNRIQGQAEQPRGRPEDNSTSNTQTVTQCPTITGPVARYVELPVGNICVPVLTPYTPGTSSDEESDQAEQPGGPEQRCNGQPQMGEQDQPERCANSWSRAEHQRREEGQADKIDRAEPLVRGESNAEKGGQAEQDRADPECSEIGDRKRRGRAEQRRRAEERRDETDQAELDGSACVRCPDQAEQASSMPQDDINTNHSADQNTQKTRQCHTRTWPVARYVELPVNIDNNQIVTSNIHIGTRPKDEQDQAEPHCARMKEGRAEQDQAGPQTSRSGAKSCSGRGAGGMVGSGRVLATNMVLPAVRVNLGTSSTVMVDDMPDCGGGGSAWMVGSEAGSAVGMMGSMPRRALATDLDLPAVLVNMVTSNPGPVKHLTDDGQDCVGGRGVGMVGTETGHH